VFVTLLFFFTQHNFQNIVFSYIVRANPFHKVCPFHCYGICNQHELISGCVTGKVSVIKHITSSHQAIPQWDINIYNHYFIDTIKVLK